MGNSLQDQFLKMGLVDKKKYNTSKKKLHDKRTKAVKDDDIAAMAKKAMDEKKKQVQQHNKKKAAQREAKEATARARQLIETHKITQEEGTTPYNFKENNTVKKIYLSKKTIDRLALGKIGIVKLAGEYQYVPADIIYKIKELNKNLIVLFNTPATKNTQREDDPYAEFKVPDDLMW